MKVIEDLFPAAMAYTSRNEGGYANDPYDPGGETIYGIAKNMHRDKFTEVYELNKGARYHEARKVAEQFYRAEYWSELYNYMHLKTLAIKLFDLGVNIGKRRSVKKLQRCINKLSGAGIKVDGLFGPITLQELNLLDGWKVYNLFVKKAEDYYRSLKTFWRFGRGWLRRLYDKPVR